MFEQQEAIGPEDLADIAAIFIGNQIYHQYGIVILHRHLHLSEGHILLHSTSQKNVDLCKSESLNILNPSQLIPYSLFLNAEYKFQTFEYGTDIRRTTLNDHFLYQLRNFLIAKRLSDLIAIVSAPASDTGFEDSVEYMFPDNEDMISISQCLVKNQKIDLERSTITVWTFHQYADNTIKCRENKRCEPQSNELYKVVKT